MMSTKRDTPAPRALDVKETMQAGAGHGVTVLAWARVDGVSAAVQQPQLKTFLCPSDPSA